VRILIDGHNAMGALRIRGPTHEAKRDTLVARVAGVAPGAVVFFDARKAPPGLLGLPNRFGVDVRYCRAREADDAIIEAVRDADAPEGLLVVTNDSAVRRTCVQLGARAMGVREFFGPRAPSHTPAPRARMPRTVPRFTPRDFGLPDFVDLKKTKLD